MPMIDKKAMSEEDVKLNCITPSIFSRGWQDHITMETAVKFTDKKGDLLVLEGGDYGRAAIWPYENEVRIQNHIHRLRPYFPVNVRYFYYIFLFYKRAGLIHGKGIGIQGLSANVLDNLLVPLPTVEEQEQIVDKIEELLSVVSKLKDKTSKEQAV